jgi:hypothetical protein
VQRRQELKQKQKQQEEENKSQFRSSPMNEVVIRYQKVKPCDAAAAAGERGRARPCHAVHTDGFAAMQCNGCFCPPWTRTGEHLSMDQAKDVVLYNASEREKSTSFVCSRYSQPPISIHRIHPMFSSPPYQYWLLMMLHP